mmetsp:Transcript_132441/g.382859  ORF Transcript_132441/g.382859 Transcript_132441/m.382859 type:complete len:338 (+) Transcript_132441:502-1515(+)
MLFNPPSHDRSPDGVRDRVLQRAHPLPQHRIHAGADAVPDERPCPVGLHQHRSQDAIGALAATEGNVQAAAIEALADDGLLLGAMLAASMAWLQLRGVGFAARPAAMLLLDIRPGPRADALAADYGARRPRLPILPRAIDGARDALVAVAELNPTAGVTRGTSVRRCLEDAAGAVLGTRLARLRALAPWLPSAPDAVDGASEVVADLQDNARADAQRSVAALRNIDGPAPLAGASAACDVALAADPWPPDAIHVARLRIAPFLLRRFPRTLGAAMLRKCPQSAPMRPATSTLPVALAPSTPIVPLAVDGAQLEGARTGFRAIVQVACHALAAGSVHL